MITKKILIITEKLSKTEIRIVQKYLTQPNSYSFRSIAIAAAFLGLEINIMILILAGGLGLDMIKLIILLSGDIGPDIP